MTFTKPDRLAVVGLWADDVPTTVHFYRDVIGLTLLPHHGHQPAFDLGDGVYLVIVQGQRASQREAGTSRFPSIAFAVQDLDEAVEHLEGHMVRLPWGIEAGPQARWVTFYDPAGNLIEFAQFE